MPCAAKPKLRRWALGFNGLDTRDAARPIPALRPDDGQEIVNVLLSGEAFEDVARPPI